MFQSVHAPKLHVPASRRSLHIHLKAALFALGGTAGVLLASPSVYAQDNITQVALAKAGAGQSRSRPDLVASNCVHEERRKSLSQITPVLVNRCDFAVALTYCVDDSGSDHACAADGARTLAGRRLAPGASVAVEYERGAQADVAINWIACRADAGAVGGLFRDQGRAEGACLVPDQQQPQALQIAAAPEALQP